MGSVVEVHWGGFVRSISEEDWPKWIRILRPHGAHMVLTPGSVRARRHWRTAISLTLDNTLGKTFECSAIVHRGVLIQEEASRASHHPSVWFQFLGNCRGVTLGIINQSSFHFSHGDFMPRPCDVSFCLWLTSFVDQGSGVLLFWMLLSSFNQNHVARFER